MTNLEDKTKFYRIIIVRIILFLIATTILCCSNNSNNALKDKSIVKNLISVFKNPVKPDLFFDSLGYKWYSDDELKLNYVKYKSAHTADESLYFIRYENDSIKQVGYSTYNFDDFKLAIKDSNRYNYTKYGDNIMDNTVLNLLVNKNLLLCFLKEKKADTTVYRIIIQNKPKQ